MISLKRLLLLTCVGLPLAGAGVVLTTALLPDVRRVIETVSVGHNTNEPAYIKDVVAYKEGDGFVVYLTLADHRGALTRTTGSLTVQVKDGTTEHVLWDNLYLLTPEHFDVTQVGRGSFERTVVLFSLGRIAAQSLARAPKGRMLTIDVSLITHEGQRLTGHTTTWF